MKRGDTRKCQRQSSHFHQKKKKDSLLKPSSISLSICLVVHQFVCGITQANSSQKDKVQ